MILGDPMDFTWGNDGTAPVGQSPRASRYRKGHRVDWVLRILLLVGVLPWI